MNEQVPNNELMDLDFTKQEDKEGDLLAKIDAANRGIKLAEGMNDNERVAELLTKRKGFEETLSLLTKGKESSEEEIVDPFANDRGANQVQRREDQSARIGL